MWVLHQRILFLPYSLHSRVCFWSKKLGPGICRSHLMFFLTFLLIASPTLLFYFYFFVLSTFSKNNQSTYFIYNLAFSFYLYYLKKKIDKLFPNKECLQILLEGSKKKKPSSSISHIDSYCFFCLLLFTFPINFSSFQNHVAELKSAKNIGCFSS